jgi:hypothetical protein
MKSLIKAVAIAAMLAAPIVSFAQSNEPVTRAQVRAELVQLEKAGYNPTAGDNATYPVAIQAAEAKVVAEDASSNGNSLARADTENSGVGGTLAGTSASGAGHSRHSRMNGQACVGPASFCNIYFGS